MKAIFSCLKLEYDDRFLPYSMPEVLNKTGHDLTDIKNASDEASVAPRVFWGFLGNSPIRMELMFSEYILDQYLTLISQRKI